VDFVKKILAIALVLLVVTIVPSSFAQSDDKIVGFNTSQGLLVIEFFPEEAPNHVKNFLNLAESGFYDGLIFHRIIPGFMIQGGDPNTKDPDTSTWGQGSPGTSVDAEFNSIKHNRGIVSMARGSDPNSAGSQFFIVHQDSNFLDQQYTVFGRIIYDESFETLDKIASLETGEGDIPVNPEEAKIMWATVVNQSEFDIADFGEPEKITDLEISSPIFTVKTNAKTYERGDKISVSGSVNGVFNENIEFNLGMIYPNGKTEYVVILLDSEKNFTQEYLTEIDDVPGTYTIQVLYDDGIGDDVKAETTFSILGLNVEDFESTGNNPPQYHLDT